MKNFKFIILSCCILSMFSGCNRNNTTNTTNNISPGFDDDAILSGEANVETENQVTASMIVSVSAENVIINNESDNINTIGTTTTTTPITDNFTTTEISSTESTSESLSETITEKSEIISNISQQEVILSAYDSTAGYSELSKSNTVKIAGVKYDKGFKFSMAASANIFGEGTQYALYNISDITKDYSTLFFSIGHIDSTELVNIKLTVYTKSINEDFGEGETFEISSDSMYTPISIDITNKDTLKIQTENLGTFTDYGIFDIYFE